MYLFPTLVLLLFPCPTLLAPPTENRPLGDQGPTESLGVTPYESHLSSSKPAQDPLSSSEPSQDVNPRVPRDAGPATDCTKQPLRVVISDTSIQRDTSGEGDVDGSVMELEPGSPLVLTHRIRLVPAPGACGGECEAQVAMLRARVERLEREVSELREKCGGAEGGCCTSQQSTGAHCTMQPADLCPNDCSNQGRCDQGKCVCFPGFSGPDCSSTTCPSNCNSRGTCVNGQCVCDSGFTGSDCSQNSCPNNCNNKGQCVNGQCVCDSGFTGSDCSENSCPNNCNNKGQCVNGQCVCDSGFTGTDCSARSCPSDCNYRGRCVNGQCVCDSGFTGTDCSARSCPNNCNYRGRCVNGQCVCDSGFTGTDCSARSCPSDCNNRGRCVNGQCVCDTGFTGTDCSARSCPSDCNNRGRCVNGQCVCNSGFTGTDCSARSCPSDCNNRGRCVNGQCVCDSGFTGTDCSARSCPSDCNNRGRCVNGQCVCNSGFTGTDCSARSCPSDCNNRGRCVNGQCVCDSGFTGTDCSARSCPSDCNNRGRCVNGQCVCDSGFTGTDCSARSCPSDCNNRGRCVNGQCVCDSGFTGTDCSARSCPSDCNNRGRCVNGQCVCDSGFTGTDCSEKSCPNNCRNRGNCVNGQCVCKSGFTGPDCSEKSCPSNCNDKGTCVKGKCVCHSGFTGTDCSEKSCPNNCRNRGNCVNGQCVCKSGFTGPDCSEKSCPSNCSDNGRCVKGKCVCHSGFTGTDCSVKSCPNKCRNRGHCVNGQCVCNSGFTGPDCSEKSCPSNCSDKGTCVKGKCVCHSGFTGTDCSEKSCPKNCSKRGRCVNGQCVCDNGFTGIDCSKKSCLKNCNNNGRCENGKCVCNSGFTGADCSAKSCPNDCSGRGRCIEGMCECETGFSGEDCSARSCPNDCSERGRCIDGTCECETGFSGEDCSARSCPSDCSGRGRCIDGTCECETGFSGADCSAKSCPNDCSGRGRCIDGTCECETGFSGEDCSARSCPNDCSGRGRCIDGTCECETGFLGEDCSAKSCPNDCSGRGRCIDGTCECETGFLGEDCSAKSCPNDCSGRGRCIDGTCECETGFLGEDCSAKSCPSDCSGRGRCIDGTCECETGFSGEDCSARSCPNDCSGRGRCIDGTCECETGFSGEDCSAKSCPNNCNNKGHCVDGRCVCHHGFTGPDCSQCDEGFTGEDCSIALVGVSQLGTKNITDSSVTVFWKPPPLQYDAYFITFTSQKEGDQKVTSKVEGQLTSYTQTGLAPGEEYKVSIRGEKDGKTGAESTTAVTTLISGPKNLHVVKTTSTSVIVQWEPPVADIDRYRLSISARQSEGEEEPRRRDMTLPPGSDSAHITGLEAGRLYDITLVSEKRRSQSQPITVEATPGQNTVPGKKKLDGNVFYEEEDSTKVNLHPGSTKPQDRHEERARPKLPKMPAMPKKPKIPGWAHFNGTRPNQGKPWQKQPGIKRPVIGTKNNLINTAGTKHRHPTITHGAPSQTDVGKRPREKLNVPEVGTGYNSQGTGENQTHSNQSQVHLKSPDNPEMGRETLIDRREETVEGKTITKGNVPHIIRKKVKVGYKRVNGTALVSRKQPRPEGGTREAGKKEGGGAGEGAASGLQTGSSEVGRDINIATDTAGSDSQRKGSDDHESQQEPLTNGRTQKQMQFTEIQESDQQEGKDRHKPTLPSLPTASSPSLLPGSGLPKEDGRINLPEQTGIVDPHKGSKPSPTLPSHGTDPSTPESQSKKDSQVYSRSPEDKGGSTETVSRGNNVSGLDKTPNQYFQDLGPGDKGDSLETVSMMTDRGTDSDGTQDQHFGSQETGDKGGSLETVSMTTDTHPDSDDIRDQHSGRQRLEDKEGFSKTVSMMTDTGTDPDNTRDRHSGSQGPEDEGGSPETVSMRTDTGTDPDNTQDQHSGSQGPEDEGGSLETVSMRTDTGTDPDDTRDRHSGSQGLKDKGGSPETVSSTTKADVTHKSDIINGAIDSSKDEGKNGEKGGKVTLTEGLEGRPLRSGHPHLRTPPLRRPHIGPFLNRSRANLGSPHRPNLGSPRRPSQGQRQQSGSRPEKTNGTSTRVSPHEPALRINGLNGKATHTYSKIGRNITSTEVGPKPNTGPTKSFGFRKVIVYTPLGTGVQKNETDLEGSAPKTGPGFTSIGVQNITSRGFVLIWEIPHGIYKKFIVIHREYGGEGMTDRENEEEEHEYQEVDEDRGGTIKVSSRQDQGKTGDGSRSETGFHARPHKKTPKFTKVLPAPTRSLLFQDLAPQTNYSVMLSGAGPGLRSKIHQFTVTTGPEPPSNLSFSNITESSLIASWTKPRSPVSGFKVMYTPTKEGEPVTVAVDSQNSNVQLLQLSPGSTYEVSVISLLGLDESDPIKGSAVTLPDPPTDLRAINVTHNKALLLWRPALATVDRYIIVYGSEKDADVRITVSGNAAERPLKGLRGSTLYSVTVSSQLGGKQSAGTSTVFTTAGGADERGRDGPRELTAKNVTPRSAVLSWKPPAGAVTGYKLTYQTAGEAPKEVTLDPGVTQYKLRRLFPMSKYTVHLQGERRGQYTSAISTEFTTGKLRYPFPTDCSQELLNGIQESGETEIFPAGKQGGAVPVFCDMETDGGGWTVFQRRVDGSINFFRSWREYSRGFGSLSGEFWLGNELLHNLTSMVPMAMRVDLRVGAESAFAHYYFFSVDTEKRYYMVRVSGYSGTAGDSMAYHDGRPFSTWDRDPNPFITRCSMSYRGGWWYRNCHEANLNGLYDTHTNHQGVIWTGWKGTELSIPFTEMKIRPASFRPPGHG